MKCSTIRAKPIGCAIAVLPLLPVSGDVRSPQLRCDGYLALLGRCNDCKAEAYPPSGGQPPGPVWLSGGSLGSPWPWGATYPVNPRLYAVGLSADESVHRARTPKARPPMSRFMRRQVGEADPRAYIHSLGAAGRNAPANLAPGQRAGGQVTVLPAASPKGPP